MSKKLKKKKKKKKKKKRGNIVELSSQLMIKCSLERGELVRVMYANFLK